MPTLFPIPETARQRARRGVPAVLPAALAALLALPALASPGPLPSAGLGPGPVAVDPSPRWVDREGRPLPWRTDAEAEAYLRDAEIVGRKVLSSGINRPTRFDLELDGVRARAIFRTVEIADVERRSRSKDPLGAMRDSWAHEIGAWKLARLLGLDHVPPAVERRVDGTTGSLQLWVERARPEDARIEAGEAPRFPARWARERQTMAVFDNLIHNFDRNHGNQLLDESGKVWFVDHTRSFAKRPELVAADRLRTCDRVLWQRLLQLDLEALEALDPWVDLMARRAVLARRDLLVRELELRIAEVGEGAVLLASASGR